MNTNKVLFSLGVFGFSGIERSLIASICKMSKHRTQQAAGNQQANFEIAEPPDANTVDIIVVNADDAAALQSIEDAFERRSNTPVIAVTKRPREAARANEHVLPRHRLSTMLPKLLLEIIATSSLDDAPALGKGDRHSRHCLVIDDSPLIRSQIGLLLQKHDLDVSFADSAETGLKLLDERPFEIVFLDVMLPGMDGYTACKTIKSRPEGRGIPVVMLTGKTSPFNKMQGALVGSDGYLTKPVDKERVLRVLEKHGLIEESGNPPSAEVGSAGSGRETLVLRAEMR